MTVLEPCAFTALLLSSTGPGRDDAGAAVGDDAQPRDAHAAQADHRGCRHALLMVLYSRSIPGWMSWWRAAGVCALRKLINRGRMQAFSFNSGLVHSLCLSPLLVIYTSSCVWRSRTCAQLTKGDAVPCTRLSPTNKCIPLPSPPNLCSRGLPHVCAADGRQGWASPRTD